MSDTTAPERAIETLIAFCDDWDASEWTDKGQPIGDAIATIESLQAERDALIEGFQLAADHIGYDGDWFESAPIAMLVSDNERLKAQVDEADQMLSTYDNFPLPDTVFETLRILQRSAPNDIAQEGG